jgi:hypothetical protein
MFVAGIGIGIGSGGGVGGSTGGWMKKGSSKKLGT